MSESFENKRISAAESTSNRGGAVVSYNLECLSFLIWSEETNEARRGITHGNMYIKLRRRECNERPSGLWLKQLLL
jgi:hypothetical protein